MSLSQPELDTITNHGSNHPALQSWIAAEDWQSIADWYNSDPDPQLNELIDWMSFMDRHKFYELPDFRIWYSTFCKKINDGTNVVPVLTYDADGIKAKAISVVRHINEHREANKNFTEVVQNMFKRSASGVPITTQALEELLVCLGSDGVLEPYTIYIYSVELIPFLRWQNMFLSAAPTAAECETALTSIV